jgi:hypothetical protein
MRAPLFFLVLLLGAACSSTQEQIDDSTMTASVNGRAWSAVPEARVTRSGQLLLTGTVGDVGAACPPTDPCQRLSLASDEAFQGVHGYLAGGQNGTALLTYRDGDAVLAVYKPFGTTPTLEIKAYEPETQTISGRFDLAFELESDLFPDRGITPPDTIRIENGRFRVRIRD